MGIGEALARAYADEGARLVLAARSAERLERVVAALPKGRALAVPTDLTDSRQIPELVDRALQRFGCVDILVNNAAVGLFSTLSDMDRMQFQRLFALNVFAPIYLIQTVLPQMKYRRQGQIVNISSVAGYMALPAMGAYSATKFSLRALTDALRVEVKSFGIHVLGVYPRPDSHPVRGQCLLGYSAPSGIAAGGAASRPSVVRELSWRPPARRSGNSWCRARCVPWLVFPAGFQTPPTACWPACWPAADPIVP